MNTLKTREEVASWLDQMGVEGYEIDEDLFVNVDGNVDLSHKNLISIPVKFGAVGGGFWCYNNHLTSLTGAPREVCGYFYCSNNSLTSLTGAPQEVGGNFYCYNNKFKEEPEHSFINIGAQFYWKRIN